MSSSIIINPVFLENFSMLCVVGLFVFLICDIFYVNRSNHERKLEHFIFACVFALFMLIFPVFFYRNKQLAPYNWFASTYTVKQNANGEYLDSYGLLDSLYYSISYGIKAIVGDADYSLIRELRTSGYRKDTLWILTFVTIICPLFATARILTFLWGVARHTKYHMELIWFDVLFSRWSCIHYFSEVNNESIAFAESIKENSTYSRKFNMIVYCSAHEVGINDLERIKKIGACCLPDSIEKIQLPKKMKKGKGTMQRYYLMSGDDDKKIAMLTNLNTRLLANIDGDKAVSNNDYLNAFDGLLDTSILLILFSNSEIAAMQVEYERELIESCHYNIVLINDKRSMCYEFLRNNPFLSENNVIYDFAHQKVEVSVAVIGGGRIGKEFVKAIYWCRELPGVDCQITVFDKDASVKKSLLRHDCPDFDFDDRIRFFDINVMTDEFHSKLDEMHFDYIIVSLGNDITTIETGIDVYSWNISKMISDNGVNEKKPIIALRLHDESQADKVKRINDADNGFKFEIFGTTKDLFNYQNLLRKDAFNRAYSIHKNTTAFANMERYFRSEYNQRSSMAAELHLHYKRLVYDKWGINTKELSDEKLDEIAQIEHRRWCAYMKTEGYRKADLGTLMKYYPITKHHVYMDAKYTPCLCDWDDLPELTSVLQNLQLRYNRADRTEYNVDFQEKDRVMAKLVSED